MDSQRPREVGAQSLVPPPAQSQVWIDFDGTITQKDVLDELIRGYAINDAWKLAEQQWQEGAIGSRECLTRQFDVVRISDAQLDAFLDTIPLDAGVFPLLRLLERFRVPYAVLSDGVDRFINRLFHRNGLSSVPIRCNTIIRKDDAMVLACPFGSASCESAAAHCKCASMNALTKSARQSIFIGDGRSDLCPSRKCATVFAKGMLATNLQSETIMFLPYSTLYDVTSILATAWGAGPEPG